MQQIVCRNTILPRVPYMSRINFYLFFLTKHLWLNSSWKHIYSLFQVHAWSVKAFCCQSSNYFQHLTCHVGTSWHAKENSWICHFLGTYQFMHGCPCMHFIQLLGIFLHSFNQHLCHCHPGSNNIDVNMMCCLFTRENLGKVIQGSIW